MHSTSAGRRSAPLFHNYIFFAPRHPPVRSCSDRPSPIKTSFLIPASACRGRCFRLMKPPGLPILGIGLFSFFFIKKIKVQSPLPAIRERRRDFDSLDRLPLSSSSIHLLTSSVILYDLFPKSGFVFPGLRKGHRPVSRYFSWRYASHLLQEYYHVTELSHIWISMVLSNI